MKKKLSISDVAREMRVSVTTVSFVLNGKGEERNISRSVIRRIQDYAKKVGYQPNPKNKKKSGLAANLIGVLLEDLGVVGQSQLGYALECILRMHGYHCVFMSMHGQNGLGEAMVRTLSSLEVKGYVLLSFNRIEEVVQALRMQKAPYVLVDGDIEAPDAPMVQTDYKAAVVKSIKEYEIKASPMRIGLVVCQENPYVAREFLEGYLEAMDVIGGDMLLKKMATGLLDDVAGDQIKGFIQDNRLQAVVFSTGRLARIGLERIVKESLPVQRVYAPDISVYSLANSAVEFVALENEFYTVANKIAEKILKQLGVGV